MKLLHITFHKGCELDIEYVFHQLGHTVEAWHYNSGYTNDENVYNITNVKAQSCWEKYKSYFDTFDGIITSDTCPTSRPFLQNNWNKLLIIWVCNRFDYNVEGDEHFYDLLRSIPSRANTYIIGNTMIENFYSKNLRNVDITDKVIKPLGKNIISQGLYKNHNINDEMIFFIPVYENETKFINLSQKANELGIKNNNGQRFENHISDLLKYKGVIYLPYAWSTITFFETMQLGIIYFVPTPCFLIELSKSPDFLYQRYWFQPPFNGENILSKAEWYCDEHKDLVIYFSSWHDLQMKVNTTDYETQTKKILEYAEKHSSQTLSKWNAIISEYENNNP